MVNLTLKDLIHQKGKFLLILLGMVMSIFLVQYSSAMWNGTLTKSSEVIDKFGYDAWILDEDNDMIFDDGLINDTVYEELRKISDIKEYERLIYTGVEVEDKDYTFQCIIIGYELESDKIEPWEVYEGEIEDLKKENAVIIDDSLKQYFEDLKIEAELTIGRVDMEIVGFCKNARFMANPFVWMSLETARNIRPWAANWSTMIGVNLESGYSVEDLEDDIEIWIDEGRINEVNVMETEELRQNTYDFIVNEAGMGGSVLMLVVIGYFVAVIIISVSTYQTIQEKIPEFGTLKAIGASKKYLNQMILGQVSIYATLSFFLGTLLAWVIGIVMGPASIIPVIIHVPTSILLYGLTLVICLICGIFSIRKVHKIDPAIVFKV